MNTLASTRTGKRGYTLLFAVLTAALVLGIAVFIVSVSTKQFELSAAAKNSTYAFYAADSGIECAALAFNSDLINVSTGATITCNGTTIANVPISQAADANKPSIITQNAVETDPNALRFALPGGTCVTIIIYDGNDAVGAHYTFIDARGYNHCTASNDADTSNPGTVERALRLGKKG